MNKSEILEFIMKTTSENGGVPLGEKKFYEVTPVKKSDWHGKIWLKWSDAIIEAGFEPNTFLNDKIPKVDILDTLAEVVLEHGKIPTEAEIKFIHINDNKLPSNTVLRKKFGKKVEMVQSLLEHCFDKEYLSKVVELCQEYISKNKPVSKKTDSKDAKIKGSVYLMKSGDYYKIGKAEHVGQRNYSIGLKLPESLVIIHEIKTDDPFGIEKYWHNRFKEKRLKGEWFDLNAEDVDAFKRRKNFM